MHTVVGLVYLVTEHHNVILSSTMTRSCSDVPTLEGLQKIVGIPRLKGATAKLYAVSAASLTSSNGRN